MTSREEEAKRRIMLRHPEVADPSPALDSLIALELKRLQSIPLLVLDRRKATELALSAKESPDRLPPLRENVVADLYAALSDRKKKDIPGIIARARKEDPDASTAQSLLRIIWAHRS